MSAASANNEARSILLIGFFVVVLVFLLSWSVRLDNVTAGSFRLDELVVCDDLDDNMNPNVAMNNFPGDTKQVCLWFEYSKARDGDMLDIRWRFDGNDIQHESFRIVHARGTRAFYLLREDGAPLPAGTYSVELMCNGRTKSVREFTVAKPPEPVSADETMTAEEED